jgi:protease-4
LFNAESLFKNKLGVLFDRVSTHRHSDYGGMTRSLESKEAASIQSSVEKTYRRFIDVVAQSRGFEKIEDVEALAEGRVWSGTRAIQIGLADEVGGLDRALAKAAEFAGLGDNYEIEIYPKPVDHLEKFFETLAEGSETGKVFGFWQAPAVRGFLQNVLGVDIGFEETRFKSLKSAAGIFEHAARSNRPATLARENLSPLAIQ